MKMMMRITPASTSRESVTARNTTTGTPFLRGRARMRRRNDRTAGAVLDSPSKRTVRTNARAPSSSEKKTTNGGNTKKKRRERTPTENKGILEGPSKSGVPRKRSDVFRYNANADEIVRRDGGGRTRVERARARVYGRNCDGGSE